MAYTELKEVGKQRYYYRARSVRKGDEVSKERVYLGVNLTPSRLYDRETWADKELGLLGSLLTDDEILQLEHIKEEYQKEPKQNLENRYEAFCSLFTYNSAAIEGNTLTLQETAHLLFEQRVPSAKSMREIKEIMNHKEAFDYILNTKEEISRKLILKLHQIVVKDTLQPEFKDSAGKYRSVQVFIRGLDWVPAKPKDVAGDMTRLFFWHSRNKKQLHPLILAAYFHSAFELIHPFVDGNGRVGRLLMNYILHKHKYPMINIPTAQKLQYYKTLETAQTKGNLRPFVEFLMRLLKEEKVRI